MRKYTLSVFFLLFIGSFNASGQTWADSLDVYAREKYLPATRYSWSWQHASLLSVMVKQYDAKSESDKRIYLDYVQKAMKKTQWMARGNMPNTVASGLGMAFLYRVTLEEKYKQQCAKIFRQYKNIRRTKDGAVSHLAFTTQLWDDTVFMIGEFLLGMYQATADEQYIDELVLQISTHRDKLLDGKSGLWVHGWDEDGHSLCTFCGQANWPDKQSRQSAEVWGRGNGWVVVTLADALRVLPPDHKHYESLRTYLLEMITPLPSLQDAASGHWYQLPLRKGETGNYLESSCTAMYAYGINTALELGLVQSPEYTQCVELAYRGIREISLVQSGKYLRTKNVCTATCIGDKTYYFNRPAKHEKPCGVAMLLNFGFAYDLTHVKTTE